MDAWVWVLVIVAVVVLVAAVAWLVERRRSAQLRDRFGREYDRRIEERGSRRRAESELRDVSDRRDHLEIRPLSEGARSRYAEQWHTVQSRFVDQPDLAVGEADRLVAQVMADRGYPVEDFDEQADLVAADHPAVAENYRRAHAVHVRNTERAAATDELRQALIHYRSLFDELLADGQPTTTGRAGADR